jgi:hypothetical protein
MFTVRDWMWLVALVAWRVHVTRQASAVAGQKVVVLQYDPFYESVTANRGIVSWVSPEQFAVDTSTSAPLRYGVVVSKSGQCLGVIADLPDNRTIALKLPELAQ